MGVESSAHSSAHSSQLHKDTDFKTQLSICRVFLNKDFVFETHSLTHLMENNTVTPFLNLNQRASSVAEEFLWWQH